MMSGTDITEIIIIGIIAAAFFIGIFLCWIAGSYLRKIYYVCVTLWEVFAILILFIGSSVDKTGIFKILLIIAVILLICILILYEHRRRLSDALNILILIWTSIAESGILIAKSHSTIALITAVVCLVVAVIAAFVVYDADEYSTILPSSFLGAAVCGLICAHFGPFNLDDDPSKIFFLMLGIEIVLTAVGCLIQIFILEKKQIIKKKIFSKKWVVIVLGITITVTIAEVAGFNIMSYESRNVGSKTLAETEKSGKTTEIMMPEENVKTEIVGSDGKPVEIQTESLKELLTDYTIKLNGESCKLPVLCDTFEQGDWYVNLDDVDDDDDIDIYTTESLVKFSAWSNGADLECQLRDGTDGNKYVVGFFGRKVNNEKLEAEFPGGIVLGKSTREDVKKVYGEESYDVYGGFGDNSLGYWKEFGVGASFGFDQDGRLTGFVLENDPQQYN